MEVIKFLADSVIFMAAFIGLVYLYAKSIETRVKNGELISLNRRYKYTIGNNLERYGLQSRSFHGIDIDLPKEFPHIYLDGHKGDKRHGPELVLSNAQKISLEGDFDKYFQAFVPSGYESLALSILSPDVMQTLLKSSDKYDVELFGSHLRLITKSKIHNQPLLQAELLSSAQVVLDEVAHRLRSWSDDDSRNACYATLAVILNDSSYKLFNKLYVRKSVMYAFTITSLIALGFFSIGIDAQGSEFPDTVNFGRDMMYIGLLFFPGAFVAFYIGLRYKSKFHKSR